MNILFVGSKIQHCLGVLFALDRLDHQVGLYPKPIEDVDKNEEEQKALEEFIKKYKIDFVMSNVFSTPVAEITNRLGMKFVVWNMDSPAYSTWVPESAYDNCCLFYFDYREHELRRQRGYNNVYHLPLAADVVRGEQLLITDEEIRKYGCDMSFVGGLYTQNIYDEKIERFLPEQQNAFSEIIKKNALVWDSRKQPYMPPELVQTVRETCPEMLAMPYEMSDEYLLTTYFLDWKLTNVERTFLMELLAQQYDIHLYTRATEYVPDGVRRFPAIDAGTEVLKVYYASKINLNITLRSIASGVPARVFDIMSVGGFVISNWQEEIPELFVEDEEIVTYKTPEELIDKADYYLRHENERIRIGVNGYRKVKEQHTYEKRLAKIISIIQGKE